MSVFESDNSFDVVVVGAGAAGQMAAIAAAEAGRRVIILEQMPRAGLKILASGGGRCNLTNLADSVTYISAFGRQGRFILSALEQLSPFDLRKLFEQWGVPTIVEDSGRVFPVSGRAADVQAALRRRAGQLGVIERLGCTVRRLWLDDGRLKGVECADSQLIAAGRIVLACGGRSWPSLGGNGGGYDLARQAGMTIHQPVSALVPLVTQQRWSAKLAGVSLSNVRVRIDLPRQDKAGRIGGVLWTHRGISGPAVLDISGRVAELLQRGPVPLRLELIAGQDVASWLVRLNDWRELAGTRAIVTLLQECLSRSLCDVLCKLAEVIPQTPAAQLTAGQRDASAALLGGLPLTVTATEGFDMAFVTRGGVELKSVDPKTLQSRTLPGLYLAGELLDLDGPTGGYNLHWAFASGRLAGTSAARE